MRLTCHMIFINAHQEVFVIRLNITVLEKKKQIYFKLQLGQLFIGDRKCGLIYSTPNFFFCLFIWIVNYYVQSWFYLSIFIWFSIRFLSLICIQIILLTLVLSAACRIWLFVYRTFFFFFFFFFFYRAFLLDPPVVFPWPDQTRQSCIKVRMDTLTPD